MAYNEMKIGKSSSQAGKSSYDQVDKRITGSLLLVSGIGIFIFLMLFPHLDRLGNVITNTGVHVLS
jgi:hypothetical protein